jgi:hypothetical protein
MNEGLLMFTPGLLLSLRQRIITTPVENTDGTTTPGRATDGELCQTWARGRKSDRKSVCGVIWWSESGGMVRPFI